MEKITIHTDFIKLVQLLKFASIVSNGSDAKIIITDGLVKVNGNIVHERGKKIYPGDIVDIEDIGSVIVEHE